MMNPLRQFAVTAPDGNTFRRTSLNSLYTHAVLMLSNGAWSDVAWCKSEALANEAATACAGHPSALQRGETFCVVACEAVNS